MNDILGTVHHVLMFQLVIWVFNVHFLAIVCFFVTNYAAYIVFPCVNNFKILCSSIIVETLPYELISYPVGYYGKI